MSGVMGRAPLAHRPSLRWKRTLFPSTRGPQRRVQCLHICYLGGGISWAIASPFPAKANLDDTPFIYFSFFVNILGALPKNCIIELHYVGECDENGYNFH